MAGQVIGHVSGGSRAARTALATMLGHACRGDTVRVASMDRLARSVVDLAQIVTELTSRGVAVELVAERLSCDPEGEDPFQLRLLSAAAQLERSLVRERQREGIAKERGVLAPGSVPVVAVGAGRLGLVRPVVGALHHRWP